MAEQDEHFCPSWLFFYREHYQLVSLSSRAFGLLAGPMDIAFHNLHQHSASAITFQVLSSLISSFHTALGHLSCLQPVLTARRGHTFSFSQLSK